MKTLFPLSIRSFRFSLLMYLLVIGSIPLLIAALIFYQQSSSFIEQEHKVALEQTHEQTILLLQQKLREMELMTKNINLDFAVQQILGVKEDQTDKLNELQIYINDLLVRQVQQSRDMYAICIAFDYQGSTICSQTGPDQTMDSDRTIDESLFKSFNPLFSSVGLSSSGPEAYGVRYEDMLLETTTGTHRGRIIVILNLSTFMAHSNINKTEIHIEFQESSGKTVYNKEALENSEGSGILISDKMISYGNLVWTSHMTNNQAFTAGSLLLFRNVLIFILLFILVISLLSSLLFSRYLMKPLLHLRGLMKRAELGDLKAYWVWESKQEMNELGNSYNQMLNRIEDLIKQVKQEEALKKDAEIEALQYQLNPHFLYNTLNTIKWVAKIHKTPQISEVVTALVLLLQSSLGKRGDFISLQEEVLLVEAYMAIQIFRYGDDIQVLFDMDDFSKTCLVPRMILQPLVENAILHGIKPLKGKGIITIKAWMDRDLLFCEVTDNGVGMPAYMINRDGEAGFEKKAARVFPAQPNVMKERMSGIGLRHIREKIRLYYGNDYKMHIFSKEKEGTTVRITLPIHRNEDYSIQEMR
ncbi:sensor histidine kinase [Paenibacillus psychroresistens]|uniref:histidine kinase n=1 Tax=Paenibacillus psychroresistens TaxID=1778678 RepID=A0A6B8RIE9_9BACL|nr:sensor histidine kinase [Paenibacillus psychroresistens]QGQ95514.1 sensor histidine kinase [Paenibacillus psychroresistens]